MRKHCPAIARVVFHDRRVVPSSPRPHQYAQSIEDIGAFHHLEEYAQIWHTCYHQTIHISSMIRARRMISKHGQIFVIKFLLTHKNFSARAIIPNWNGTQVEYLSLSQSLVTCLAMPIPQHTCNTSNDDRKSNMNRLQCLKANVFRHSLM